MLIKINKALGPITAQITAERSEQQNPAAFYEFLFMGVHSPCSPHSPNEAGFVLLLSTGSHLPPNQISLPVSGDTAHAFPHTDLDISARQQCQRSGSPPLLLPGPVHSPCLHGPLLEATLPPLVCPPLAGPAIPALGFHSTPCHPHHNSDDNLITAPLPHPTIHS